ncbi:hypothetical protein O6H91_03G031500 [Diphasiastrum complanatum]|uniref:Uncharacterized protein n=1 Tax=Diphasiastrum complanatum TaxID=34168 RepID=A0ACC2E598_DIPCM|nr:hypothetical protein O6H91_03G031500 [Diphasiastrum complanatum]
MVTMELDSAEGLRISPPAKSFDDVHYSRLIHTIGKEAVEALHRSKVLILGCRGVGAEIAKNLICSGIGGVGLVDEDVVSNKDLGAHMFLKEGDVGQNRAVATARNLSELNPSAEIVTLSVTALEASIKNYHVVAATVGSFPYLVHLNNLCRSVGVYFVAAIAHGIFSFVFVDLGEMFSFVDQTAEPVGLLLVESITQDCPATITVVEEQRHGLADGDEVIFYGVRGMEEVNKTVPYPVSVTGTSSFTIPVDSRTFGRYISGGYFHKLKRAKDLAFLPLGQSLNSPDICTFDSANASLIPHLHIGFQALDEFETRKNGASITGGGSAFSEQDLDELLKVANELWDHSVFAGKEAAHSNGKIDTADVVKDGQLEERPIFEIRSSGSKLRQEKDSQDGLKSRLSDFETDGRGMAPDEDGGSQDVGISTRTREGPVKKMSEAEGRNDKIDSTIVRFLAQSWHTELCPIAAIIGGVASQEVIKAISKVLVPLHQWLYFDAMDCLPSQQLPPEDRAASDSRYDFQISLFGRNFQQSLKDSKWLVVGAGGIGSELLKNLVLMGVGCSSEGQIVVTDMDNVSKSNLTNQALYQIEDIGRPKTPTAARALRRLNPAAQIHALQEKFELDSESVFDSSFFESISVDTASSRLYIDMRCVSYRRPMIDGGKHGTKGSVQVFVPFNSEMYASTQDAPEHKEIPICTLRNFPYATEHTIQWAVTMFESLFKQRPLDVNAYLSSRDYQDNIRKSAPTARLPILETLRDALVRQRPLSFEACVQWARLQFEELFSNNIKQLLFNFPPGMTTTAGAPFWSGTKRIPTPVIFDPSQRLHIDFIVAASNLQATVYGLKGCQDRLLLVDIIHKMDIPHFEPKEGVKIAISDNELRGSTQRRGYHSADDNDAIDTCAALLKELPTPATLAGYRLSPIEFQKDDEHNFHAEFVAAAANLRASNYGIPFAEKLQARLVGGQVIPAMITSTAVVGGLMCLELYKLLLQKPLADHRHTYFNLALPLFCYAQPLKAVEHTVTRVQGTPLTWTLWDRFEMDCVDMKLEKFLAEFKRQHGLDITMISYGKSLLYAEFLPRKKLQDRMSLTLLELITVVGKVTIPAIESKAIFSISCTDANDNDVEVPDVVAKIR